MVCDLIIDEIMNSTLQQTLLLNFLANLPWYALGPIKATYASIFKALDALNRVSGAEFES